MQGTLQRALEIKDFSIGKPQTKEISKAKGVMLPALQGPSGNWAIGRRLCRDGPPVAVAIAIAYSGQSGGFVGVLVAGVLSTALIYVFQPLLPSIASCKGYQHFTSTQLQHHNTQIVFFSFWSFTMKLCAWNGWQVEGCA